MAERAKFQAGVEELGTEIGGALGSSGFRRGVTTALLPGGPVTAIGPAVAAQTPEDVGGIARAAVSPTSVAGQLGLFAGRALRGTESPAVSASPEVTPAQGLRTPTFSELDQTGPTPPMLPSHGAGIAPSLQNLPRGTIKATGVEENFATPEQIAEDRYWTQKAEDMGLQSAMGTRGEGPISTTRGAWDRFLQAREGRTSEELPTTASVIGDTNLTGMGGLAAINLASRLAGQERGVRYKAQAQQMEDATLGLNREKEARQAEVDAEKLRIDQIQAATGQTNAEINAENARLSGIKTQFDIAKGLRELGKADIPELKTVEMGDIDGTKRTYVQTPQGYVPFEEYQLRQRASSMDPAAILQEARAAVADGKDKAAIAARLQALGIDPAQL